MSASLPLHSVPELHGNLDRTIPFDSIVFRPTSASFNGTVSLIPFTDGTEDPEHAVIVVFLAAPWTLAGTGVTLPPNVQDSPGMWVVEIIEGEAAQAVCVTDGTTILKPEVRLAECIDASDLRLGNFEQNPIITNEILTGILDAENPTLMAIEGCEFFFRFTRPDVFEFLGNLQKRLPLVMSEEPSQKVIDHIPTGTLIAFTNNYV